MSGELTWDHAVADIPDSGLSTVRRATPDELEADRPRAGARRLLQPDGDLHHHADRWRTLPV